MARLFGFHPLTDPRFTADVRTDIGAKLATAVAALERHPLTFVHFKAPDILAHDRNAAGKRDFIERIDRELGRLGTLRHAILVTADHSTDSGSGSHTADPVPVLYFRPGGDSDSADQAAVVNFSEAACRIGNQPRRTGSEMLREVIQFVT
jgi:2,3-bisphosphoglycerate-independent phosphoglycerate mutase